MWTKYGQEPHMSGVALQHQTYTVTGESNTNISGLVRWVLTAGLQQQGRINSSSQ